MEQPIIGPDAAKKHLTDLIADEPEGESVSGEDDDAATPRPPPQPPGAKHKSQGLSTNLISLSADVPPNAPEPQRF